MEEIPATTWAEATDEQGDVTDPFLPPFVTTEEAFNRWQQALNVACLISEAPRESTEARNFAATLYEAEGKTAPALEEARLDQWRNRLGEFIDMPDVPQVATGVKASPGTDEEGPQHLLFNPAVRREPTVTLEQIRELGLDEWPEKGEAAKKVLGDAADTFQIYGPDAGDREDEVPVYDDAREVSHEKLLASLLAGKTREPNVDGSGFRKPQALFMAGGPASGKTTILDANRNTLAPPPQHTVHVDVDKIKDLMANFGMPEYQSLRDAGDHYAATAVHKEAGDIAAALYREAVKRRLHVIVDGTGDSDPGKFTKQLTRSRDAGYDVNLLYVTRPTDEAVVSAITRAEDTGRFVPIPEVREQHRKVSINFRDEISKLPWLSSLHVFDAQGPIGTMKGGQIIAIEPDRYAGFVDKADEKPDEKALRKLGHSPVPELDEAADPEPKHAPETWSVERPHDSSDYLDAAGPLTGPDETPA